MSLPKRPFCQVIIVHEAIHELHAKKLDEVAFKIDFIIKPYALFYVRMDFPPFGVGYVNIGRGLCDGWCSNFSLSRYFLFLLYDVTFLIDRDLYDAAIPTMYCCLSEKRHLHTHVVTWPYLQCTAVYQKNGICTLTWP
jgi:hypothetical protein